MSMNDSLKKHVQKITDLPTLPATAQRILAVVDDNLSSVRKLESVIENDPPIAAKILSVANSAFWGFNTPAKNLSTAIIRIGFNNVKNIAVGISLMTVLNGGRHRGSLGYERIFNHSVAVGFIASLISEKLKMGSAEEALISGMLHDIGFLVLSRYFPDSYEEVLQALKEDKGLIDAEIEVLNFTHADIGRWLAEKWNLPDAISDTISFHHMPSLAQVDAKQVAVVHLADYITTQHVLGVTRKDPRYVFDASCLDVLGMTETECNEIETQLRNGSLLSGLFKL
jgi:putative nucleotidyltransferase with HDIG domain